MQAKPEVKTSSLRSVRVKSERMKDNPLKEKTDNESPIKTEPPEESDVKPAISLNSKSVVPTKDTEPLTSAVAPVAQKVMPEASLSPTECKEEGAVLKTEEAASASKDKEDDDVVEVPYKPQVTVNPDEECKSNGTDITPMQEVKRRKLDILKEGGLEVTPVTPFVSPLPVPDTRPSVIQQATAPRNVDAQYMPPPPSNTVPIKRPQNNILQVPLFPELQTLPKVLNKPNAQSFNHLVIGQPAPKVVQSKSIYSYSEKTVYGNPKAIPTVAPVHSPRPVARQSGGDVLDLRVTSPQKPVVEIMRVPAISSAAATNLPLNSPKSSYRRAPPAMPMIEGRKIGSNLEITLVGPQNAKSPYSVHKYSANTPASNYSANKKFPYKRTSSDNYMNSKYCKVEENGKNLRLSGNVIAPQHVQSNGIEIAVPSAYVKNQDAIGSHMKSVPPQSSLPSNNSKQFSSTVPRPPPVLTNYLPLLQSANKTVPPFMPVMDPLYLSALQTMYSSGSVPPPPPLFPMATPEQLQLYSELMAQNARARFTFPFPSDTNPSVTTEHKKL